MKLQGSMVALITPMRDDGSVDYDALHQLIDWHVSSNTHAIVSVGTTGESSTLSVTEHLQVIRATVDYAAGRIPVIAGTGANSTSEAVELTRKVADTGVAACLSVVPYYNKPNQRGMVAHFLAIADASHVPVILYNVPSRTVADLTNDSVVELMHHERIVGIKDATGDVRRGAQLIELVGQNMQVYSGDDLSALELMRVGATGTISVTANVAPAMMSQMCSSALSKDFVTASQINERLLPLHQALFVDANPMPVKYAVHKLGYTHNVLRLPLTTLDARSKLIVDNAMQTSMG